MQKGNIQSYTRAFTKSVSKLPRILYAELLDRFIRGCNPDIRLDLERAYSKKKDKGECLDLMEAIRLAETEDRYFVKSPQGFHPKKGRFGEQYLASLSRGGNDVKDSSSDGEK